MISMPDLARLGHLAAAAAAAAVAALALTGCSGSAPTHSGPPISDNAEFIQLVEDARGEMREGNLANAGRLLEEARKLEPENAALWVDVARLRFRRGEHFLALAAADQALKFKLDYGPALLMRAQLVRDSNGLAESLVWFEAAVQADPRNPEVLSEYAATLGDLGRNRDMLKVVRELETIADGYPQVFYLQAVLAARAGEPVLARSLLAKSGLFQRGVPAAMLLDALIDIQQGTPDTAVKTLDQLVQRQPANRRAQELLARALWLSGRDEELVNRFGARATAPDASPYLTMLVGRAHERRGARDLAAPLIEAALVGREVQMVALGASGGLSEPTARVRALISAGNPGGAAQEAAALLRRFPDSSDIRALAGDAAVAAGDGGEALARYTKAASVRRPWPLTRKIIAVTRAFGDDRAADALLTRAVIGEPRNVEALLMLAQRRAQLEDWNRVARLVDGIIALGGGNDPKVFDLRARAAEAQGRGDQAARFDLTAEALRPSPLVRRR
jgi:predicted Zn-dependent protease